MQVHPNGRILLGAMCFASGTRQKTLPMRHYGLDETFLRGNTAEERAQHGSQLKPARSPGDLPDRLKSCG